MDSSRRGFLGAGLAGVALGGASAAEPWRMPEKGGVDHRPVVRITMADGVRLCGQLWLPEGAATRPAPVVFESIPYRTRDAYSAADAHWGATLAAHGIGFARIDVRGSGDSEGLLADEYLALEQDDAVAVIAWLAAQPWCNGAVGMRGISWGGFATLATAMRGPPALKAIMPMACSDRRYTDDAHWVGGCLGLTNFKWGVNMKAVMAGPPDPEVAGPAWLDMWQARLEASPAICARWTGHEREDAYWRHGSLAFDYAAIRCPAYVVGGWADAYVSSVPRLLAGLKVPRKGLVGPWGHTYPWLGGPGPALDWAYEEVRWWSHWLKREPTGIMAEPMLRYYCPDATPAQSAPGATPGRWTAEAHWPSPSVRGRRVALGGGRRTHRSDNAVGLATPEWVPFGQAEMPGDQTADDARSLTWEVPLPAGPIELLGTPHVRLRVAADRPAAQVAVRLNKLTADGKAWRLAYGLLNLTHRDGHATPKPLVPGQMVEVEIELGFIAQRLLPGERLRLAVSEGLWPLVWPSPDTPTLTVDGDASHLVLPLRAPPAIEPMMPIAVVPIAPDAGTVAVTATDAGGQLKVTGTWPDAARTCANGTILSGYGPNTVATVTTGQPNSGIWSGQRISRYRRGDWNCELHTSFELRSTPTTFELTESIAASNGGKPIFERTVSRSLPRRLV